LHKQYPCDSNSIVTLNLLQHDGCTTPKEGEARAGVDFQEYNCSRNFTGWLLNYLCFNNGYHTIHHAYPTMHWSVLKREHEAQIVPKMDPRLDEPSIWGCVIPVPTSTNVHTTHQARPKQANGTLARANPYLPHMHARPRTSTRAHTCPNKTSTTSYHDKLPRLKLPFAAPGIWCAIPILLNTYPLR